MSHGRKIAFDLVALTVDITGGNLSREQKGKVVVETLAHGVFEVYYCNSDGPIYAIVFLQAQQSGTCSY